MNQNQLPYSGGSGGLPPMPPYTPGYYRDRPRHTGEKRDLLYGGVCFFLSLLCVNFLFYGGCGIAFAVTAMALFGVGLCYLLPCRRGGGAYMLFCCLAFCLCALSLVLWDSNLGKVLNAGTMVLLSGITLTDFMDLRKQSRGSFHCIFDWIRTVLIRPLENMGDTFYALFHKKKEDGTVEKRKIDSVLIGLVCAVPVLLLVIPLLMGADGAFEGLMDKMSLGRGTEMIVTLIFGFLLFLFSFGQHFSAKFQRTGEKNPENTGRGIDGILLATFLSVISLVYVMYLVSQLAYFFHAFAGLLPKDFTVAQYARRGFFEMAAVCGINLVLLLVSLLGARKKGNGKEPVIIRIFALFLCLFSLVLIATAMSKMVLYIRSFGLTYLRLVTSVFMVFLCVVFLTMGLWIFLRRLPYMRVVVITAVLLVLSVGYADPARVVADYNVNAYLTGTLDSLDMSELRRLGSHAVVPYARELTEDPDPWVSEQAWRILYLQGREFGFFTGNGEQASYDWRSFNVSSYKAYTLIREHEEEILSNAGRLGYVTYGTKG